MAIRKVSEEEHEFFLLENEFTVVLFDTPWDVGPGAVIRPIFEKAEETFRSRVNFGEVNLDEFPRQMPVPIANVPAVAYYQSGKLIAALVGASQDLNGRIQAMLDGKPIDHENHRLDPVQRTLRALLTAIKAARDWLRSSGGEPPGRPT